MLNLTFSLSQILVWLITAAITGTLAGWLITRKRAGFGWLLNILIGLVGVAIGTVVFQLLSITIGGLTLVFTANDMIAAFAGSVIAALFAVAIRNRRR